MSGGRPGEEGDVRVYDIDGGKPRVEKGVEILDGVNDPAVMLKQAPRRPTTKCSAWRLSPDGKHLAAGGCDRLVRVLDLVRRLAETPSWRPADREPCRLGPRRGPVGRTASTC